MTRIQMFIWTLHLPPKYPSWIQMYTFSWLTKWGETLFQHDNNEELYIHCFSRPSLPCWCDRRSYQVFLGVICHKTINYRYYKYSEATFVSDPALHCLSCIQIKCTINLSGYLSSKEYIVSLCCQYFIIGISPSLALGIVMQRRRGRNVAFGGKQQLTKWKHNININIPYMNLWPGLDEW